jgi:7-cyano-7-deazaguanine synthase in queuosine biosynthesis
MSVSVYFSTGRQCEEKTDYTHAIGLEPTSLPLKVHHNLGLLGTATGPLPDEVLTFLMTSIGIWAADKSALRQQTPDAWTRRLRVSFPAAGWAEALKELSPVIGFLTGDDWSLEARPKVPSLEIPSKPNASWHPDCVCLFSGGVDSLAGAIDLLEAGHRVLLVSHYDFGQLASAQNLLTEGLTRHYGPKLLHRWGFRVQFEAPELSLRSRSLLFIALGVAATAVWGRTLPLYIPENGWISLNPPLTGNRLGSYSTRTTHPYFIAGLKHFLNSVGITQELENPFQYVTKGEMLAQSRNPELLRTLLEASISCAHPVASRWKKNRQGNCGYCFPCLMRRAALNSVGWDNGREYLFDVLKQPEILASRARGADLRSLLYLVRQWQSTPQPEKLLWQSGPIPGERQEKQKLVSLVAKGIAEMSQWLGEKVEELQDRK